MFIEGTIKGYARNGLLLSEVAVHDYTELIHSMEQIVNTPILKSFDFEARGDEDSLNAAASYLQYLVREREWYEKYVNMNTLYPSTEKLFPEDIEERMWD